jgi:hypothetical protein
VCYKTSVTLSSKYHGARFEVPTAVGMKTLTLWIMKFCTLLKVKWRFQRRMTESVCRVLLAFWFCWLNFLFALLRFKMKAYVRPKYRLTFTGKLAFSMILLGCKYVVLICHPSNYVSTENWKIIICHEERFILLFRYREAKAFECTWFSFIQGSRL